MIDMGVCESWVYVWWRIFLHLRTVNRAFVGGICVTKGGQLSNAECHRRGLPNDFVEALKPGGQLFHSVGHGLLAANPYDVSGLKVSAIPVGTIVNGFT